MTRLQQRRQVRFRAFLSVNLELHKRAPSPEKFLILGLNMISFGAFWVVFLQFNYLFVNWQLHISLTRTAQIHSELHFCVELHTKKALVRLIWRVVSEMTCQQNI